MTICFKAARHKLTQGIGFFELLGFDFMIDVNFNVSTTARMMGFGALGTFWTL